MQQTQQDQEFERAKNQHEAYPRLMPMIAQQQEHAPQAQGQPIEIIHEQIMKIFDKGMRVVADRRFIEQIFADLVVEEHRMEGGMADRIGVPPTKGEQ